MFNEPVCDAARRTQDLRFVRVAASGETAGAVRQHGLEVDALSNTSSIFQFDVEVHRPQNPDITLRRPREHSIRLSDRCHKARVRTITSSAFGS